MKYNGITFGQAEAVFNKLGGPDGVQRFLSGELVVKLAERIFPVWKTIKLGMPDLRCAKDFGKAIKDAGMKVNDDVLLLLGIGSPAITTAPKETEIDLVLVTVAELGFKRGATRQDIYKRAEELGLELCPIEVAPQLRLQYKDQPYGKWALVATPSITDVNRSLKVFAMAHDENDLRLSSTHGGLDRFWNDLNRWVFVRPRK